VRNIEVTGVWGVLKGEKYRDLVQERRLALSTTKKEKALSHHIKFFWGEKTREKGGETVKPTLPFVGDKGYHTNAVTQLD